MLLVVCQLSRDVISYEDLYCHRCVSIPLLSKSNSRLLFIVKLSVVLSFSRSYFCLIQSIRACLHGGGVPQIGRVTRLSI